MRKLPTTPLHGHITEVSVRKGETPADILSVTNNNGFVRSLDVFDKQVFSQDVSNYKLVRFGDIAYNPSRINVGSVALCKFPDGGAVSPMYVVVRCRKTILPQYLLYFLKSDVGLQHIAHRCVGAVRFMLRFQDLERIDLPLPPINEQERIVQLLDETDTIRRLRNAADVRTSHIESALFCEMFGDPLSNPKRWTTTTLGELGTIVTGNTPPRSDASFYGDFIDWIKTDNIDPIRGIVGKATEQLSAIGAARGRIVPEGSVIITCIAGSIERIGDAAITDRQIAINQQINAIIPRQDTESVFLGSLVNTLKPLIQANATGVMTRILNKSILSGIPAFFPPRTHQKRFANCLANVRKLEGVQSASWQRLNDLFRTLAQRAYQGEV